MLHKTTDLSQLAASSTVTVKSA